jgi:hypothetical protein
MEYIVGGEIRLGDFVLPSLKNKYEGHPDLNESGHILIPLRGDGDYYWARKDLVQKKSHVKHGARGPVFYIEVDEGEKEFFPSTKGGLLE